MADTPTPKACGAVGPDPWNAECVKRRGHADPEHHDGGTIWWSDFDTVHEELSRG